jgi:lysophospholipase L1-like esterase
VRLYVALGDSMSIDRYPDLDHAGRQHLRPPPRRWLHLRPPPRRWLRLALPVTGLGAASLLAHNDDQVWPEFAARDLATRFPGIDCRFLAVDGATTEDVLASQVDALPSTDPRAAALVTVTAGGNDLLGLIGATDRAGQAGVGRSLRNLDAILEAVRGPLPQARLLVANVYDPTDGTGDLEGHRLRPAEMGWLRAYNEGVAGVCGQRRARLVDVHGHFAGHGRSAPAGERWYWTGSLIEPGLIGASEIRRLWLSALDEDGS